MAQITIDCFLPFPSASFARGLPDLCLAHPCSSQWWRRFQFSTALTASAAAVFCAKTGGAGQPASTASVCALQSGGLLSCSLFLLYIYRRYLRAVATATTANSKQAKKKEKSPLISDCETRIIIYKSSPEAIQMRLRAIVERRIAPAFHFLSSSLQPVDSATSIRSSTQYNTTQHM